MTATPMGEAEAGAGSGVVGRADGSAATIPGLIGIRSGRVLVGDSEAVAGEAGVGWIGRLDISIPPLIWLVLDRQAPSSGTSHIRIGLRIR